MEDLWKNYASFVIKSKKHLIKIFVDLVITRNGLQTYQKRLANVARYLNLHKTNAEDVNDMID